MIARLQGQLLEKEPPALLVDVSGVGYEVLAPMSTFYSLPETGDVVLHTHFSVTENAHTLYGFASKNERRLFRVLIKVNGVGPKMALSILSGMEPEQLVSAIANNDVAALVKIPGVGKKTAERLVVEVRDKFKDDCINNELSASVTAKAAPDIVGEAESAMIALGYKPQEAAKAISRVLKDRDVERSEELIRLALRSMLPA